MEITKTTQTAVITTDDSELFSNLSSKLRENFAKTLASRNKIMAFFGENEQVQKKYFFKLVAKIFSRTNDCEYDFDNINATQIKIVLKKENSLQIMLNIKVKFDKNQAIFDPSNSQELFNKYLVKSLQSVQYTEFKNIMSFNFKDKKQLEKLENILNHRNHLRYIVDFDFDKDKFEAFKKKISVQNSPKYRRRFRILANLLSEHFEALGVSVYDDFDTVRASYLELSKVYHPDRNSGGKKFADKFQKISVAYEALKPFYKEQDSFIKAC